MRDYQLTSADCMCEGCVCDASSAVVSSVAGAAAGLSKSSKAPVSTIVYTI